MSHSVRAGGYPGGTMPFSSQRQSIQPPEQQR